MQNAKNNEDFLATNTIDQFSADNDVKYPGGIGGMFSQSQSQMINPNSTNVISQANDDGLSSKTIKT